MTINGIEFSEKKPTKPGAYWLYRSGHIPEAVECYKGGAEMMAYCRRIHDGVAYIDCLWSSRLVPADEMEKAYQEGWEYRDRADEEDTDWSTGYDVSLAKRVVEGEV